MHLNVLLKKNPALRYFNLACKFQPVRENEQVKAISYTAARETLAATMKAVCEDREPVIITRKREDPVVMMSLDDFEAMQETNYLRRSPANAERLEQAMAQLEAGEGVERELPDLK